MHNSTIKHEAYHSSENDLKRNLCNNLNYKPMKNKTNKWLMCGLLALGIPLCLSAQSNFSGQILQRGEYMHGFGTLADTNQNAGSYVGQRSRLNFNHNAEKFRIGVSVQDIRVWGSTPQIKAADGMLSVHEAWGEIIFSKKISTKVGRQELNYDDARFLGNLDWALQARAHDIALFKFTDSSFQFHAGLAYNQNEIKPIGNFFSVPNQYKAAQFMWMEKQFSPLTISFIAWNNGMQFSEINADGMLEEKILYSQTIGLPKIEYSKSGLTATGFGYYQMGKTATNKDLAAYDAGVDISYVKTLNDSLKNKIRFTLGYEVLSGTSQTDTANKTNNSYNPMYGTNHRFNGYMDYFYVSGRHANSVGLQDVYLKVRYDFNTKLFMALAGHYFMAAADVRDKTQLTEIYRMDDALGTEIDFTLGYIINEAVSLQGGYSQMFATETMKALRGGSLDVTQNWAYVSLLFRPNMKARFTGLKF